MPLPPKRLDVTGDINLTGTIFSAGTSGSPTQVLSSTGTGLEWVDAAGIGSSFGATNGLQIIGTNIGLGGTLTQNTEIGTSSFGLSFIGINSNTQALYISSHGRIGIGTTGPGQKLSLSFSQAGEAITSGLGIR